MTDPVKLAVIGLGRIGAIHARHAQEIAAESGDCRLVALVDTDLTRAEKLAAQLEQASAAPVRAFASIDDLIAAEVCTASIVATPTDKHREHAEALVEAGQRVLLEKPMTEGLGSDREFARNLNLTSPDAVMLAFQRRFDDPLCHAKKLLDAGAIGRPFKIVSILEDSRPLPDGYHSPGLLQDMSVHNVDEVLWLSGQEPSAAACIGSRIYSHELTTADEDFDDAFLYLWFDGQFAAHIQVSRNHVSGYRVETWIFGEEGNIHVGHFEQNRLEVPVEAYGRDKIIDRRVFRLREYGGSVPEFVDRFGPAYRNEVTHFVKCCRTGEPFGVDQNDGLRAMEVIDAAGRSVIGRHAAGKLAAR